MRNNASTLATMLDTLEELGLQHAVFGGLAVAHYGMRKLTTDVDMLVSGRLLPEIQKALEWRGYKTRRFPFLLKMYLPDQVESVGDLVVCETNSALQAAFLSALPAVILGLPVHVVQRGALVALKFDAAVTPRRQPQDRTNDVFDIRGILQREFGPQDELLACQIAEKIYPGAAVDLRMFLKDLRAERWPKITRRAAIHSGLLIRRGRAHLGRPGLS